MLYDTVEIKLTLGGEWEVLHREIPYERKECEQWLNGVLGTFHYPRNWGKEKAFKVLRDRMIEERLKVITGLQNQIEQLRSSIRTTLSKVACRSTWTSWVSRCSRCMRPLSLSSEQRRRIMRATRGPEPEKPDAMYTATLPTYRSMPFAAPIGDAATAAFALLGSALAVGGTGSVFDISRAGDWRRMLEARVPFHVDVGMADDSQEQRPDLRSASDHLGNIRQVLNPAIADLATVFGVSRQAIYKWIGGEATPEPDKFERIRALSHAADAFRDAGITRASSMLKMKAFDGRSLMDLAAAGQILPSHIRSLIAEAQAMDAAYDRSGLAKSKAKVSDDWRTEMSIPGFPER